MHVPGAYRLARLLDRFGRPATPELPEAPEVPPRQFRPGEGIFETRPPSPQHVVDLWAGNWASDLSRLLGVERSGGSALFDGDGRPGQAAAHLGRAGRLDGMSVLELGPLEGGHSWKLEQLGAASIVAVEASAEAYLKCLAVKEMLGLARTRYLFGDVIGFLEAEGDRFDLIFCSGILYHMSDPIRLIGAMADRADRCFVWTHYRDGSHPNAPAAARPLSHRGFDCQGWSIGYGEKSAGFWGGNQPETCWLERDDILRAFQHFGLTDTAVLDEMPDHPHGPAFTFAARRSTAG